MPIKNIVEGKIVKINSKKGYAFISTASLEEDVYLKINKTNKYTEGQRIKFTFSKGKRGYRVDKVIKLSKMKGFIDKFKSYSIYQKILFNYNIV